MAVKRKKSRRSKRFVIAWMRDLPRWGNALLAGMLSIVPVFALCWTYKSTGADELRNKVYQPLYMDLAKTEAAIDGVSPYGTNLVGAMAADGRLERIPPSVRRKITGLYPEFGELQSAMFTVKRAIQQQPSLCVSQTRTEESDRTWATAIATKLRSAPEVGISSLYQFKMKHAGRSAALDVRNPEHAKVAFPGGPTFTILDWLNYPALRPHVHCVAPPVLSERAAIDRFAANSSFCRRSIQD
jgi:hypothetical protein